MEIIRVVKNWHMVVRSCPYCKEKNGGYVRNYESNIGWGWRCFACGEDTPMMVAPNKSKEGVE